MSAIWSLLKTFSIPLIIFALRNGTAYYNSIKQTYILRQPQIRPVPPRTQRALNLLFLTSVAYLLYTLPYFSPPNVFTATASRLQTPTSVLFTRLAALPTHAQLRFAADIPALKEKLTSQAARLIYFAYGPSALAHCPFCTPSQPNTYLLYSLPAILTPHLLHLLALGLATSKAQAGPHASRWRTHATLAAMTLLLYDIYSLATYPLQANTHPSRATAKTLDFFHWRARTLRGVALCLVDLLLAAAMYLSATNRFFVRPATVAEKAVGLAGVLEASNFRLWGAGNVRNAVVRDQGARAAVARYWQLEHDVYEDADVVAAVRAAVSRVDMRGLQNAADMRAGEIVGGLDGLNAGDAGDGNNQPQTTETNE